MLPWFYLVEIYALNLICKIFMVKEEIFPETIKQEWISFRRRETIVFIHFMRAAIITLNIVHNNVGLRAC